MATVAELDIAVRAKADHIDRDLREVEKKVKTTSDRMGKDMKDAMNFGKFIAGLTAAAAAANVAMQGIEFATAAAAGQLERMDRAANELAQSIRRTPILGQVFQLGQEIGDQIFNDRSDAEAINAKSSMAERERIQNLKNIEDGQKRILMLTRETELLGAGDDNARKRLQAQFKLDDELQAASRLPDGIRQEVQRLAEDRFRLETRGEGMKLGSAQQIGARTSLSNVPPDEKPSSRRQTDITNNLLQNIVRVIAGLENQTVAQ